MRTPNLKPNIAYICPTRGKPDYVDRHLTTTIDKARLPDTVFVLGIDEDERELYERECRLLKDEELIEKGILRVHVSPRPDSLGEKFNLIAASIPDADAYIMGVDDLTITEIAWDLKVNDLAALYEDGVGTVLFGKQWNEPALPAFQLCTRQWCELQGFFMAPFFPFWWHDTWNLEMGAYLGRNVYTDMTVEYPTPDQEPPTPRRDIVTWALFFDMMRPWRLKKAHEMLQRMDTPAWYRFKLLAQWAQMAAGFEEQNRRCRDPLWVQKFMENRVEDVLDERHQRLQARAQALLAEFAGQEVSIETMPRAA